MEKKGVLDFYEPWQPRVGQRVRFRFSPECDFCKTIGNEKSHGRTGIVCTIREPGNWRPLCPHYQLPKGRGPSFAGLQSSVVAHRFTVHVESEQQWMVMPYGLVAATHFAACELEPV